MVNIVDTWDRYFGTNYNSSLSFNVQFFVLILYVPVNNFSVKSGWIFLG